MMEREMIDMQLTPEERSLLLKYGYPFGQTKNTLAACESSDDIEIIPMDRFEFERLIGDVSISINEMQGSRVVQSQLLDLYDRLEYAERYGDGTLETL